MLSFVAFFKCKHLTFYYLFLSFLQTVPLSLHLPTPTAPTLTAVNSWLANWDADFSFYNHQFCSLKHWHMRTRLRHKTNANIFLQLNNNRRPLVFTKCLFNENCYVSSLSGPLMPPVLLQVPQRCCNIWCWKGQVRLNTHHLTHSRVPTDTSQWSLLVLPANSEVHAISLDYFQWQTAKVGC